MNTGKILTVSGPVVDCGFETGQLPAIREALHVTLHGEVRVMEVVQQLSATRVRCVLLGASRAAFTRHAGQGDRHRHSGTSR